MSMVKRIDRILEQLKAQQGDTTTLIYGDGTRQTMPTYLAVVEVARAPQDGPRSVSGYECAHPGAGSLMEAVRGVGEDFEDVAEQHEKP